MVIDEVKYEMKEEDIYIIYIYIHREWVKERKPTDRESATSL